MSKLPNYVAYVDLLGVGDASEQDSTKYFDDLLRFRQILCISVDDCLNKADQVYAFSDCAFVSSSSLVRIGRFLSKLQGRLWEHLIFLKGAIAPATREVFDFWELPGQDAALLLRRKERLHGFWFSKEFVQPALMEKKLKGIGVHISAAITDERWLSENTVYSAYYSGDALKKPTVFRDLLFPQNNLRLLDSLLRTYLMISHSSRRYSRYYIPLILTWINSQDYSDVAMDSLDGSSPPPLKQLLGNRRLAGEIIGLPGGDLIYFSLLNKISQSCEDQRVVNNLMEFIGANKKLRSSAEFIPNEICSLGLRHKVTELHVRRLMS